jgi:hypothetical protein
VATGQALIYDPRGHTFESWSSLMVEAYASQQLQMNVPEDKWLDFATGMMAIDIFQNDALPSPYLFSNWHDWAEEVVGVVTQPR